MTIQQMRLLSQSANITIAFYVDPDSEHELDQYYLATFKKYRTTDWKGVADFSEGFDGEHHTITIDTCLYETPAGYYLEKHEEIEQRFLELVACGKANEEFNMWGKPLSEIRMMAKLSGGAQ